MRERQNQNKLNIIFIHLVRSNECKEEVAKTNGMVNKRYTEQKKHTQGSLGRQTYRNRTSLRWNICKNKINERLLKARLKLTFRLFLFPFRNKKKHIP